MSRMPDPVELDPAAAGLIRANLTGDKFATERILTSAIETDLDGLFFAFTVANLAGRILVGVRQRGPGGDPGRQLDQRAGPGGALALRPYISISASSRASAWRLASGWAWASRSIRAAYSLLACRSACCAARHRAAWPARASSSSSRAVRLPCSGFAGAGSTAGLAFGVGPASGSGADDGFGSGVRCGGQGSPASMAAWCCRAMARSAAWRSTSNSRHHPAVVRGSSG